ncbi:hypothetical protein CRE_24957 [Caenorhabditis remanei]|uniref:F-box domain-containing protein n=1 Tax=Caenorhabditis remanei TaxID=31234 RepID=E3MI02_CAERE|nr:hypothetical protein CRE_24957 [Caenorhabditis remanei]
MTSTDTEKPFRLLNLPLLAFNRVIQNMSIQDILKFALSSKRTKTLVRLGNHKLESFKVELRYFSSPEFKLARSDKDVCCVTVWRNH